MSVLSPAEARDVVQHQILAALAQKQEANPRMCFKGGTLLRACWAEQYRFSEDLDSRAAGLITDGPDSFEALLAEWHERITESLDAFDSMVENERPSQTPMRDGSRPTL